MPYLPHATEKRVRFTWEGRAIEACAGVSVAAALYAANVVTLGRSRKFRRSRGLSGSFPGGHLLTIDGVPHCRSDTVTVRDGMQVHAENVWPSLGFDILRLGALMPRRWVRAGFEHPRWVPDGSFLWPFWERALWFAAGMAEPPLQPVPPIRGGRLNAETVVIGGGPAGRLAAVKVLESGQSSVVLISEGTAPGRTAEIMGAKLADLPSEIQLLTGHQVFALYRNGKVVGAAPLDPSQPAILIDANSVVLATGQYSVPPLVSGADLPGVMDAKTALKLSHNDGVMPGRRVVVIGTNNDGRGRDVVAGALTALSVEVVDVIDVSRVRRIVGRHRVTGIEADGFTPCDAVVHAGPWRSDPALPFQAGWSGDLRLMSGTLPAHVSLVGSAARAPESVAIPEVLDGRALVCPCMDVTVEEIRQLVSGGESHVEVLKRRTGCGMGACQGIPCWDNLAALVSRLTGESSESIGHPTYRPPRAGITVAQAAGLDHHVAWDKEV